MRVPPRLLAVGFGQNLSYFLAWSVIPVWASFQREAPPWQLGLLPAASSVTYVAASVVSGRFSDRVSRSTLARAGLLVTALFLLAFALAARAGASILALSALTVSCGLGSALIWPAMQAKIADLSEAGDLERNLGDFSLTWSLGKTVGFLVAGAGVYGAFGIDVLFGCAALSLALVLVQPPASNIPRHGMEPLVGADDHAPAVRRAHLRSAWWANFAAYGMGATMVYLYPDLVKASGRPEWQHFLVLGTLFLAQTAGFRWFGRNLGWRYRLAPLLLWQAAGAAAILVIGQGPGPWLAVPAAAVLGLSLGQSYTASVYYSVHAEEERGARAGIHEALIGAGDFSVPLLGGLLATWTAWSSAPCALAAAVTGVAMIGGWWCLRAAPTSPSRTSRTGSTSPG
jgi:MFS family permease